jgi:hypothetical protein
MHMVARAYRPPVRYDGGAATSPSPDRDGVPASAFPAVTGREPERLPQRDFDLGHGLGLLPGAPQMLLALGVSRTARAAARRPAPT